MQPIMDKLYSCLTELDFLIQRQRTAMATNGALATMTKLEKARQNIRAAQIELSTIEGDMPPK